MIIVGERLNSTRAEVLDALRRRDGEWLVGQAQKQKEAGSAFIDLNCAALLDGEIEALNRHIPELQERLQVVLSLDSPNPAALEAGLRIHRGRPLLNSLSGEPKKLKALLPLIGEFKPKVIALCMDDAGLPSTPEESLDVARRVADLLLEQGLNPEDVFFDPLVRPVGIDPGSVRQFLSALEKIKAGLPGFKTIAGLSNVSFGMPSRRLLNRTFLVLCLKNGLDAAILDPLDRELMDALSSSEALLGREGAVRAFLQRARGKKSSPPKPDRV
ncbi:MAG: dihydropteroate synthase [Candidatus Aminicenantes bacterium]|nr:dihydropteroate synthase [Candidatus Aminicenantes bacterium]